MGTRYAAEVDPIANVRNKKELRDDCTKHFTDAVSSALKTVCEENGYSGLICQDSVSEKANIRVASLHMELTLSPWKKTAGTRRSSVFVSSQTATCSSSAPSGLRSLMWNSGSL